MKTLLAVLLLLLNGLNVSGAEEIFYNFDSITDLELFPKDTWILSNEKPLPPSTLRKNDTFVWATYVDSGEVPGIIFEETFVNFNTSYSFQYYLKSNLEAYILNFKPKGSVSSIAIGVANAYSAKSWMKFSGTCAKCCAAPTDCYGQFEITAGQIIDGNPLAIDSFSVIHESWATTTTLEPTTNSVEQGTTPETHLTTPGEQITTSEEQITTPEEEITTFVEPDTSPVDENTSSGDPYTSPVDETTTYVEPDTFPVEENTTPWEDQTTIDSGVTVACYDFNDDQGWEATPNWKISRKLWNNSTVSGSYFLTDRPVSKFGANLTSPNIAGVSSETQISFRYALLPNKRNVIKLFFLSNNYDSKSILLVTLRGRKSYAWFEKDVQCRNCCGNDDNATCNGRLQFVADLSCVGAAAIEYVGVNGAQCPGLTTIPTQSTIISEMTTTESGTGTEIGTQESQTYTSDTDYHPTSTTFSSTTHRCHRRRQRTSTTPKRHEFPNSLPIIP